MVEKYDSWAVKEGKGFWSGSGRGRFKEGVWTVSGGLEGVEGMIEVSGEVKGLGTWARAGEGGIFFCGV
ncbi:unnamed protein product [Brassica oleracea]